MLSSDTPELTKADRDELRALLMCNAAARNSPAGEALLWLLNACDRLEYENVRLRQLGNRQRDEITELNGMADAVECLRDIGSLIGCDHVDDPDGRRQLINCVEQSLTKECT